MSHHAHQTAPQSQRNGRTDDDYDDAHEWLRAALATTMLTTSDSHSLTMASAYLVGEALRPRNDGDSDDDDAAADAIRARGNGTLAFALLAFLIGGASLAALALYLMVSHSF